MVPGGRGSSEIKEVIKLDRLFDTVLVRPPSKTYWKCVSTNPEHKNIDVNLAIHQHREYVKILKENDIKVIELPPLEEHPDSVFVQDTSIIGATSQKALICRFGEPTRRGEEISVSETLKNMGFETIKVQSPGTIEGGDVLVTDQNIVFIGISPRTNEEGISQFRNVFPQVSVREVKLTKVFHLLSAANYLGNKRMAISPQVIDISPFQDFKLITIPEDELYANNMLYLGENRVLMPAGYPETMEKLKKEGFKPIEVDVSEFWKGDGGVTCLNSPFYKPL